MIYLIKVKTDNFGGSITTSEFAYTVKEAKTNAKKRMKNAGWGNLPAKEVKERYTASIEHA